MAVLEVRRFTGRCGNLPNRMDGSRTPPSADSVFQEGDMGTASLPGRPGKAGCVIFRLAAPLSSVTVAVGAIGHDAPNQRRHDSIPARLIPAVVLTLAATGDKLRAKPATRGSVPGCDSTGRGCRSAMPHLSLALGLGAAFAGVREWLRPTSRLWADRNWLLYGYFLSIVWGKSAKVSKSRKAHGHKTGVVRQTLVFIGEDH
jgi:hypothetical protein